MAKYRTQFEDFPNEIIMDICQYLNAREVFQCFYNLNNRFKNLLQSFDHLCLSVSLFDQDKKEHYEYLFLHIRILTITRGFNINLRYFKKLHSLILYNPKETIFEQLNHYSIPYIEYISIKHKFLTSTIQSLINDLYEKIFSNHFFNLKSCNLSDINVHMSIENCQQILSLKILKVGEINIIIYQAILSSCPNLYFFQLKKPQLIELSTNIIKHLNLKQLIIKDEDQTYPWNDDFIKNYLIYVPNIEKLIIHRKNFFKKITEYLNYNWLAMVIIQSLHLLQQFNFILHIYGSKRLTKCYTENIFYALKQHFIYLHKNQYKVQIKFIQE